MRSREETTDSTKRFEQFDILYFLGMVFIVDGHCFNPLSLITKFFPYYSFHIQLFIFSSGYLSLNTENRSVLAFIWHKFKRLMFPFYIWNCIYGLFVAFLRRMSFNFGLPLSVDSLLFRPLWNGCQFTLNSPTWYLPCHFIVECISYIPILILKQRHLLYLIIYFFRRKMTMPIKNRHVFGTFIKKIYCCVIVKQKIIIHKLTTKKWEYKPVRGEKDIFFCPVLLFSESVVYYI